MKIFITGGNGFIGTHITNQLLEQRHQVVVYDNFVTSEKPSAISYQPKTGSQRSAIRYQQETGGREERGNYAENYCCQADRWG